MNDDDDACPNPDSTENECAAHDDIPFSWLKMILEMKKVRST